MIEKVREAVRKEAEEGDWKYHITPVVKYSKMLAKELGVSQDIAELAALLHDIGRIKFGPEDHEVTGVPEAEKIMKRHGYPKEVIEEVKHCVASHRGSKDVPRRTTTAKIVANADAMAHFDNIPGLIRIGLMKNNNDMAKAEKWVSDKIERDWKKKITLPAAKRMIKKKYEAARLVLDSQMQNSQSKS